jgi:hypothetical protein
MRPLSGKYIYAWGNNSIRADLKGKKCVVVTMGSRMFSVLVEFENGTRVITSRRALRKAKE